MGDERKIIRLFTINKDETQTHYHQHIELIYLLGGSVDIQIDDQTYSLSADDFLIINANKTHSFTNSRGIIAARFEIDYNMLAEMLGTTQLFFWCNTVVDRNEAYDKCRDLLDKILIESYEREQINELQLHAYYYQLLSVLTSNFLISQNEWVSGSTESKDKDRMQKIQSYIQSNYQSQVSLNDLAKKLYLSNAYLSKYIKRNFGVTFVEYLNRVRMFHAVDELMYTDKNLTHIALDNGFPTSASFNRAFKEAYGVTPSEYRKRAQQEMSITGTDSEENGRSAEEIRSILREKEHLNPSTEDVVENRINALSYRPEEPVTERGINIKFASTLLRSEVQEQLLDIRQECGLEYIRIRLNVDRNRVPVNETILDQHSVFSMMDFLVENKIRPNIVIELSRDQVLSSKSISNEEDRIWLKKIWEPSEQLIRENILHMINRYGIDAVEKWSFEFSIWPEAANEDMIDSFCYCFSEFYNRVKALSGNIKIGIGSFILGFDYDRIKTIVSALDQVGVQPDYIAFSSFQKISLAVIDRNFIRNSTDGNFIYNQMQLIRKYLSDNGIKVKDIHINEWNHTISDQNAFNDSCEQAAYILKNLIAMKGQITRIAYWHAIDTGRGTPENRGFLTGDSGLISRYGIYKPSYFAMLFFNKLMPLELQRDEYGIVTTNGRNRFVIVCCNYKTMTYVNARMFEEEIHPDNLAAYLSNNEHVKIKYCIYNVSNGKYTVRMYYINPTNGSIQDTWKKLGYKTNLTNYERIYMRKSAQPCMEIKNIEVKNGMLEIESELAPQEIRLFDIQFMYD